MHAETTAPAERGSAYVPTIAARTRSPRLGVTVVSDLVDAIVRGDIEPGSSLPPEAVLCEQFGVSRTVIRESVKRLEEKGLVAVAQGRGTRVLPIESWNMIDATVLSALVANDETLGVLDDLSMVRATLEALIARDAAQVRTQAQLDALRDALQLMRDTIGDEPAFNQADVVFHAVVGEMTDNRLADNIVKTLFHQARSSARFSLHSELELTLDEHVNVFAAIEAGDPVAAEAAMRTHITDAWERRRPPSPRHRPS
ncbi:MAG: FadR/GntR family transcriptional regulator [Leifsonia flava]